MGRGDHKRSGHGERKHRRSRRHTEEQEQPQWQEEEPVQYAFMAEGDEDDEGAMVAEEADDAGNEAEEDEGADEGAAEAGEDGGDDAGDDGGDDAGDDGGGDDGGDGGDAGGDGSAPNIDDDLAYDDTLDEETNKKTLEYYKKRRDLYNEATVVSRVKMYKMCNMMEAAAAHMLNYALDNPMEKESALGKRTELLKALYYMRHVSDIEDDYSRGEYEEEMKKIKGFRSKMQRLAAKEQENVPSDREESSDDEIEDDDDMEMLKESRKLMEFAFGKAAKDYNA